jgi:DNA-binding HxlR family transcriptional regulator
MLGHLYEKLNCSAARALEIAGERWSLLILRDALFRGTTRFSDFERSLGIASNILAKRLESFVDAGLMELRRYAPQPEHDEYVLTAKGLDFKPVIIALTAWGDRWAAPHGPPVVFEHRHCGGRVEQHLHCGSCHVTPKLAEVIARATSASQASRKQHRRPGGKMR